MTHDHVGKLLAFLKAAYPRQEVPPETAEVYAACLKDLDFDAAYTAVRRHVATSTFWPSIAELRQAAARAEVGAPEPELAWAEVMREVGATGRYRAPRFSHPAVEEAVKALDWQAICNSDGDALGVLRAHFYRTYAVTRGRALDDANAGRLLASPAVDQLIGATAKRLTDGGRR